MFTHGFPFDPSYGYSLERLLEVPAPPPPDDFAEFWKARYERAVAGPTNPQMTPAGWSHPDYAVLDLCYRSTDDVTIRGWALTPRHGPVRRGFVVGHGYGGRDGPDLDLPFHDAALLFPCFRGLSRSRHAHLPGIADQHVVHGLDNPHHYIIGGCVEDLWLAVSALQELFPGVEDRVGYLGISFGGGVGALALPWDTRIRRAHLNVPTFGNQPLRLALPTVGSGEAVRRYQSLHGHALETLAYYDAASAAQTTHVPVHVAAALFDPVVAPPGQFAIFNALAGVKELFVLDAGHFDYPAKQEQDRALKENLANFFEPL